MVVQHDALPQSTSGRPLLAPAARGTALALALVAATWVLARFVGDDLQVTPPGQPAGSIPLAVALGAAAVGSVMALAGAALARRTSRPRTAFLVLACLALALSFASPAVAATTTATALWLSLMHVAVAAGVVPPLARTLATTAREAVRPVGTPVDAR